MSNYLTLFDTQENYLTFKDSESFITPNVTLVTSDMSVHYNPLTNADKYLTFIAKSDGTFQLSTNAVNYSLDNGTTWTELTSNTASPTVTAGSKIMWKASLTPTSSEGIGTFSSTAQFDVEGNVMSLLFGDNFKGQIDLTVSNYVFKNLFSGCTNVVNAENMALPATALANFCYYYMFQGCTNLTTAPVLPATKLASYCYSNMFNGCTSLTTAPELPATTLVSNCYNSMFYNCTSLTTVPTLPAITLANYCYSNMFQNCTSLNYIKAMFTTTPSNAYTSKWVYRVASSGTFVKNSAATWDVTGANGVPTGWTVVTE